MDPPLISETSFSAANPSAYSLAEIWPPFNTNNTSNNNNGMSLSDSIVTNDQNGHHNMKNSKTKRDGNCCEEDDSSKLLSSTTTAHHLNNSCGKRAKVSGSKDDGSLKAEAESSSADGNKEADHNARPEPPKDYIHVRARRGQATDSHSLAERARREKISERMKILQDLVPGCNKVIGKALVLDEIINYIQSLQRQVEFLSMKLETVNSRMSMSPAMEGFPPKELGIQAFDAAGMMFGSQAAREYQQGTQPEWLHMQLGGSFGRAT